MASAATATSHRLGTKGLSRESLRLAAIDVGSNSIHMIVAQADADGGITTLWRMKEMVGLGRLSFPNRRLSKEAIGRAVAALGRFQQAAQQRQAEKIVAVATSAVREAENGGDLLERARDDLGMYLRIVSAREEARLIYLAVRHAIPLRGQPHLLIDIGGGSVEFIVGDEKHTQLLESRKLGAARMTAQFVKSDPISERELLQLRKHYEHELVPLVEQIKSLRPVKAIGTSGTLENLAVMCGSTPPANGDGLPRQTIERHAFEKLLAELLESSTKDRARIRGLDDQRKDQIVAGAVLVGQLFDRLHLKRIDICPMALREGILLDYLSRHLPDLAIRREVPDARRRSVIDLARRCDWHKTHSQHVAGIALKLFDELRPLHGMNAAERELVEFGALLHDIGWHIGRSGHHKHSMYLILHGDLKNFSEDEIKVIANIARYHRKATPALRHENYSALPPRLRQVVDVGAALLRLSDGLDRSHGSVITDLRCRIGKRKIRCVLIAKSDAELEIWGARRKMDWFKKVFGRSIEFELAKR
jgi:exopolyphosphatase/guanosine-5'-triphosphate,3'-diphosphate pyrophosphatase